MWALAARTLPSLLSDLVSSKHRRIQIITNSHRNGEGESSRVWSSHSNDDDGTEDESSWHWAPSYDCRVCRVECHVAKALYYILEEPQQLIKSGIGRLFIAFSLCLCFCLCVCVAMTTVDDARDNYIFVYDPTRPHTHKTHHSQCIHIVHTLYHRLGKIGVSVSSCEPCKSPHTNSLRLE